MKRLMLLLQEIPERIGKSTPLFFSLLLLFNFTAKTFKIFTAVDKDILDAVINSIVAFFILLYLCARLYLHMAHNPSITEEEADVALKEFRTRRDITDRLDLSIDISPGKIIYRNKLPPYHTRMRFAAGEQDIEALSHINSLAFRGSAWAEHAKGEKYARNLDMWRANAKVFYVITDSDSEDDKNRICFFSHIIPLSEIGFHRYFIDRVADDNHFRSEWIAKEGESCRALLLFTIAAEPRDHDEAALNYWSRRVIVSARGIFVHIQEILKSNGGDRNEISLYFQNSDEKFARLAQRLGMEKSDLLSRDKETVYVTTVSGWRHADTIS